MKNNIIWSALVVIVVVAGLLWLNSSSKEAEVAKDNLTSREVALTCTTDMATEYQIHPELTIMVNGEEVLVPKDLGINPDCMTAIHTHGEKHILHVESPVQRDFTLGDFFAVWEKDFSSTKLLDNAVTETSEIVVTVNGALVNTFENTILRDKDKIVITYKNK